MGMSSSPTDWYDTIDPNEYIGEPSLTKNTDEPKTGSENMDSTNITDEKAMAAFSSATGFTPELPAVIEWVKQTLTDFNMPRLLKPTDKPLAFIDDWANTEVERNTYYLNALIAADAGIWATDWLDKYCFGSTGNGALQMDEVLTAFAYEVTAAMVLAYIGQVWNGVSE